MTISYYTKASHVFGGTLSMKQIDRNQGKFKISLTVFIDINSASVGQISAFQTQVLTVRIFKKQNNQIVDEYGLSYEKEQDFQYDNTACSSSKQLKTRAYIYSSEVIFDLTNYSDNSGYYVAWEWCCRNQQIVNILNPEQAGVALYLEFPALKQNGSAIEYSSPEFNIPNGESLCIKKRFTTIIDAKSYGSNVLKYKVITPLIGHNDSNNFDRLAKSSPYPEVQWQSGFSGINPFKSSSNVLINDVDGKIEITPQQLGLFVFAVRCEQYQNGILIGFTQLEFQLPVIDCSTNTPPVPIVSYNGSNVTDVNYCPGENIILSTSTTGGDWNFQWKKDGDNIIGATQSTLSITEKGQYAVTKSFKNSCANDTTSVPVNVKEALDLKLKISKKTFCESDTALLTALVESGATFEWFKNTTSLGITPQVIVNQSGKYILKGQKVGSSCIGKDSVDVVVNPKPILTTIDYTPKEFCSGDSVKLLVDNNLLYEYQWITNNSSIINAKNNSYWTKQGGEYFLNVKEKINKCEIKTGAFKTVQISLPSIKFDSIPAICLGTTQIVNLIAQPSGGIFTWNNTVINNFDISSLSTGRYDIFYTIQKNNCKAKERRVIEIKSLGCSTINTTPLPNTILNKLVIPSAFTPNNDGTNDTWEIFNIKGYPDAEILIYNRWGEPVFYSKGYTQSFDGTKDGNPLPEGVYAYAIKLDNTKSPLTGTITILR